MLTFKKANGEFIETVEANEGDDIVDVSWEYDLDIEGEYEGLGGCDEGQKGGSAGEMSQFEVG